MAMLERTIHGAVSLSVIGCATYLDAIGHLSETGWAAAVGAGITTSGAVSVLQGKLANGHVAEAEEALHKVTGGRRTTDPPGKH